MGRERGKSPCLDAVTRFSRDAPFSASPFTPYLFAQGRCGSIFTEQGNIFPTNPTPEFSHFLSGTTNTTHISTLLQYGVLKLFPLLVWYCFAYRCVGSDTFEHTTVVPDLVTAVTVRTTRTIFVRHPIDQTHIPDDSSPDNSISPSPLADSIHRQLSRRLPCR